MRILLFSRETIGFGFSFLFQRRTWFVFGYGKLMILFPELSIQTIEWLVMETNSKKETSSFRKEEVSERILYGFFCVLLGPFIMIIVIMAVIIMFLWETFLSILVFEKPEYSGIIKKSVKDFYDPEEKWSFFLIFLSGLFFWVGLFF